MIIRSATPEDVPGIVELTKLSLGERLMPKSIEFWNWKHTFNPFGRSKVLLALDNEKIIGIRAFMAWSWKSENKTYSSVRAVDTATHPNYQGKGIFKKLTLQLVETCREAGVDFIFNTPNKSSKPGYLKMGWSSMGRMKVYVKPVIPFASRANDFDSTYLIKNTIPYHQKFSNATARLATSVSEEYLNWRYGTNPNIRYYAFSDRADSPTYLTIFRLKPFRWGTEFRICDTFSQDNGFDHMYRNHLLEVIRSSGATVVTSTAGMKIFPTIPVRISPEITIRPLSFDYDFLNFNFWKPSLGDLEVF